MNYWTILGYTLLGLGFAFCFGSLGFMVWAMIDLGYYWGAAITVIITGPFIVAGFCPYGETK